jgi:hypothetical protein
VTDKHLGYSDPFTSNDPRRKGRRIGSRAKLAKRFFEDTYAAWEEQGPSILARAAFHDPVAFANMVARLMPQKIEVSTPTDGMSDERLAEMLDFAERMAGLKAEQAKVLQGEVINGQAVVVAHKPVDENGASAGALEGRGGGPLREEGGWGEKTPYTQRPIRAEDPSEPSNALNKPHERPPIKAAGWRRAEKTGAPVEQPLPYPVGKPFATPNHQAEKQNRQKLADNDPVDPSTLF